MDTVMRRALPAVLVALVVAMALVAPATAAKKKGDVHKPPYKKGPSGGDEWNHIEADPKTGEMAVMRLFPGFSPVVGCAPEPAAGWAMFRLPHHVTDRVSKVTVNFDGTLDPYAWVSVVVRNGRGDSIGIAKFQGPHAGAGKVNVPLFSTPKRGSHIEVEFGAQLGDSCPQVGWAVLSFPSVAIK
jgi:hypothetical protein